MEPLISVIVPVYKVEKYLDRCVESIVNQTYKNLEIILVDDGSPDNSPQMCDEWAKKDNRIRVIHKDNGGVSSARNEGLDIAQGEYIGFVDADDYIDLTMYSKLYEAIIDNNCDISICNNFHIINDITEVCDGLKFRVFNNDVLKLFIEGEYIESNAIWNKLYKNKNISGNRFDENIRIGEDLLFNYYAFKNCSSVVTIEESLYYYVFYKESAMRNVNKNVINRYFVIKRILEHEVGNENNHTAALIKYLSELLVCCRELLRSDNKQLIDDCYPTICNEVRNYYNDFKKLDSFFIKRINLYSLRYFPKIFKLMYFVYNKFRG